MSVDVQKVSEWFDRLDTDGSGFLTVEDWQLSDEEKKRAVTDILKRIDDNGDGRVSREELISAVQKGTVSLDELLAFSPSK